MKEVRIIGVPEHFNLPWKMSIECGEFEKVGIDLQWTDIPEGSGKMCEMLRNQETDIAIILTEGIIKDLAHGNQSVIVQEYVKSPLVWGIHVDANSLLDSVSQLENKITAISRFGSGSHLMSVIHAKENNWNVNNMQFEVVNTIDSAVIALRSNKADYFMWEKFMTQPLVDNKIFKRVGEFPTPWPCFVIAVRKEFYDANQQSIELILELINQYTSEFKQIPSIDKTIASIYQLKIESVIEWLSHTTWSQSKFSEKTFQKVQNELFNLQLIPNLLEYTNFIK